MTTLPKLFLDNRINVSEMSSTPVRISGQQINYYSINPDGTSFPAQIIFNNIITPSLSNTLVGRNIRLRYQVAVGTGNATDALFPKPQAGIASTVQGVLRAYPLQSICNAITLTINGSSSVVSQRQVLSALQRAEKMSLKKGVETQCPTQADNLAVLIPDVAGSAGHVSSGQVLSQYINSPDASTRGSFNAYAYSGGATNVYYFDVCESILVSPLSAEPDEVALPNINTLSLQLNYNNTLDMTVFGAAGTNAPVYPAGLTVTISNPVLELTYFSVPNSLVHIPRMYETDYTNIVFFNRSAGTIVTNVAATVGLQSDTLRLTSTPSLIYVYCRPNLSVYRDASAAGGASCADFFLPLGNLATSAAQAVQSPNFNITFGNRSGLCSSMTVVQAYRMSARNGFQGTLQEWLAAGCVLIFNPALDFGLSIENGDTVPGSQGSVNFQIQASFNNSNILKANALVGDDAFGGSLQIELVVVASYAGKCIITADNCVFTTGFLSAAEVDALLRTAPKDGSMMSDQVIKPTIQGAGLFSRVKSVLGHVARGVGAVAEHADSIGKVAQGIQGLVGGGVTGAGMMPRRR